MMQRRDLFKAGLGAAGAAAMGTAAGACAPAPRDLVVRGPGMEAGIRHIVVVMMENRSFDHWLGWLDGADTFDPEVEYLDDGGSAHVPYRFEGWESCRFEDPDHSRGGGFAQLAGGACDGWLRTAPDTYPISYHTADQQAFWQVAAPAWTVCDNYFTGLMAPTWPNRILQHCGRTDRMDNELTFIELPTIWQHLAAAGLEGRYYFSDAPFAALFGPDHLRFSRTIDQFRADARSGRLPHVSFVDPGFAGELVGASNDYHPLSDIRLGDRFLHDVYEAVATSPAWEGTVLVVNFDEWGGFFDHVPPPVVAPNPGEPADWGQLGFRVPCLVASPFARRGHVAHGQFDHCSVLRMIEWAFDLTPLTARTGAAGNLADVLDLSASSDTNAPRWDIPWFSSTSCLQIELNDIWHDLISTVRPQGWPV